MHGAGVAALGLLAECGRWTGQATPAPEIPRIGYLGVFSDSPRISAAPFLQGRRDLLYTEGQNILTERRWVGTDYSRLPALAAADDNDRVAVQIESREYPLLVLVPQLRPVVR
jgi:hypothetical protein